MSKREINLRQSAIINRLRKSPATLKEINQYLLHESELREYNLTISDRTFQRDRHDILSLYNISIECNKAKNQYFIANAEDDALNNRMLEAFNTFNALNASVGMGDYLQFEHYAAKGTENFHGILHSVKHKLQMSILYQSYWSSNEKLRHIRPYYLKEFKNRWYLVAFDIEKEAIRTFALDRITEVEITKKKFTLPSSLPPKDYFSNSFGIIAPDPSMKLESIVLSFSALQGKYIKSLPLHSSQEILSDTPDELIVSISVYPTFDLEMQLLSYGENVRIISPHHLQETIKERLTGTLALYSINTNRNGQSRIKKQKSSLP